MIELFAMMQRGLADKGVVEIVQDQTRGWSTRDDLRVWVRFSDGSANSVSVTNYDRMGGGVEDKVVRGIEELVLLHSPVLREAKRLKWMKAVQLVRARKCGRQTW